MYTGYRGFGDYTDSEGNLVASNIDTPEGSPSPIPATSQGPVVNAPGNATLNQLTAWVSSNATLLGGLAAFATIVLLVGGRKR